MRVACGIVLILALGLPLTADCAPNPAAELLELAKQRFGELTPAETKMLEAAATGNRAECANEGENTDPANAASWGADRIIHADRIAWLCTDSKASECVSYHGVRVKGARIDGGLDLEFGEVRFPLLLSGCGLTNELNLRRAHLKALYLNRTHVKSILADGVKVDGDVFLKDGFSADGEVRLIGATIDGNLECDGGVFKNAAGNALCADGIQVRGNVHLRNGFRADGEVRLILATIGGNLGCNGGVFNNAAGNALSAGSIQVQGHVLLRSKFRADGQVHLIDAIIGGNLQCTDAVFKNAGGKALSADRVHVTGGVFLNDHFNADGEVRLLGATIADNLGCDGGVFNNAGGYALNAENLHVEGSAFLREGFQAQGCVSLVGASVRRRFEWSGSPSPQSAAFDLRSAQIGTLVDDETSWPAPGHLSLQGLEYDELGTPAGKPAVSAADRIRWLGLQPRSDSFSPQPYEQLAKVLRESGDEQGAREVLIAKNQERAMRMSGLGCVLYWLYGKATGYGYRPWNVLWVLGWMVILGWVLFKKGFRGNVMACTRKDPADYCPTPCALVYSIESLIPLVNLRHAEYWMPDDGKRSQIRPWRHGPAFGTVLRIYLWFHILMGWILSTLLAISLSGLIRA